MSRFGFIYNINKLRRSGKPFTRVSEVMDVLDTTKSRILLITLTAVLAASYLWLVNSSATAGFYLSDLDQQVVQLEQQYRDLELTQADVLSLQHVQDQGQAMNMVAAGTIDYVGGDSAVAFVE